MKERKLVYGVGINDADYTTRTSSWTCPFFRKWKDMLARCYSEYENIRHPTYLECYVVEDWLYFSRFKSWMQTQDWEDKVLDKDLLVAGNKEYGPNTCLFVSPQVNTFLVEKSKGDLPVGTSVHKEKFQARCAELGKDQKYLGVFNTAIDAHNAWLSFKLEQAYILAAQQTDERVAKALIDRYENYKLEGE